MEVVAQVFGLSFVGIILICLVWTIGSYIANEHSPNNKLEENLKKLNKKTR